MNDKHSEETRSFHDPMAPRVEAAQKRRNAQEAAYPQVTQVYDGFYLRILNLGEEGGRHLLGAEGIIGSSLGYDGETGFLLSSEGHRLTRVAHETTERLAPYVASGWRIKPLLSALYIRAQDKSAAADIAFICWAPMNASYDNALSTFSRNISERLASGDRASLVLSQTQFIRVLRSGGEWFLTKTTKREPLDKGTVVYKARRSSTERVTGFALRHKVGCSVLATLFWILVVAGCIVLAWLLFS